MFKKKILTLLIAMISFGGYVYAGTLLPIDSTMLSTNTNITNMNTYINYCKNQDDELVKDFWNQAYYSDQSTVPLFVRGYRRGGEADNRSSLIQGTKVYYYNPYSLINTISFKVKSNLNEGSSNSDLGLSNNALRKVYSLQGLNSITFGHNSVRGRLVGGIAINPNYEEFVPSNVGNGLGYSTNDDINSLPTMVGYGIKFKTFTTTNQYSCRLYYSASCGDGVVDAPVGPSDTCKDTSYPLDGIADITNGCVNGANGINTANGFVLRKNPSFQAEQCDLGAQNGQPGSTCSSTCQTVATVVPTCSLTVSQNGSQVLNVQGNAAGDFYDTNNQPNNRYDVTSRSTLSFVCAGNSTSNTFMGLFNPIYSNVFFGPSIDRSAFDVSEIWHYGSTSSSYTQNYTFDKTGSNQIICSMYTNGGTATCRAMIRVNPPANPTDPTCGSLSGAHIYDVNAGGDASTVFNQNYGTINGLCQVGSLVGNVAYTNGVRSWTCAEGGSNTACQAYEDSCGNRTINQNPNPTLEYTDGNIQNMTFLEQCDQLGDRNNGDGCSATCQMETPICSGTVSDGTVSQLFQSNLFNTIRGTNINFAVDQAIPPATSRRASVSGYYFENFANTFLNPKMPVVYSTSHIYNNIGTYIYGFQIFNSGNFSQNMSFLRPSVRCTGQISVSNPPQADIRINKRQRTGNNTWTTGQLSFISGDVLGYRILVHNSGHAVADGISILDNLGLTRFVPSGRATGNEAGCTNASITLDTNGGVLGANNSRSMSGLDFGSTCSIIVTGSVIRDDFVDSALQVCSNQYNNTATGIYNSISSVYSVVGQVLTGNLSIAKTFSGTEMSIGSTGTFDIVITNAGLGNIYNISLADVVTGTFTNIGIVSQSPNLATMQFVGNGNNTISGHISSLAPGQIWTGRFEFWVPLDPTLSGLVISNTGTASAPCYGTFTGNDDILLTYFPSDTHITKYQSGSRVPGNTRTTGDIVISSGDYVSYRLVIGNSGGVDADNIEVRENLPMYFSGLSRNTGANCNASPDLSVSFDGRNSPSLRHMSGLSADETCDIYINGLFTGDNILVYPTCDERFVNNADLYQNNNFIGLGTVSGQVLTGNIQISKIFLDDEYPVGGTGAFQITITNNGPGNIHGINLTDNLSGVLKYNGMTVGSNPTVNGSNRGGQQLTRTNINLGAGETRTGVVEFEITGAVTPNTQICNTGFLDGCFVNGMSSGDCFETIQGNLQITKEQRNINDHTCIDTNSNGIISDTECPWTSSDIFVNDGDRLEYRIYYLNTGTDDIGDFSVVDDLTDVNFSFGGQSSNPNLSYTANNRIYTRTGNLVIGQSGYIYITGSFNSSARPGIDNEIHNTAIINGIASNTVRAIQPNLRVNKYQYNMSGETVLPKPVPWTQGSTPVRSGNNFAYRIVYENMTNMDLTNVVVSESIPTGFVFGMASISSNPNIANPNWNVNQRILTFDIGNVASLSSGEIIIIGYIDGSQQTYLNIADIAGNAGNILLTGRSMTNAYLIGVLPFVKMQRNGTTNPGGTFDTNNIAVRSGDMVEYLVQFENLSALYNVNISVADRFPTGFVIGGCRYGNDPNNLAGGSDCMGYIVSNNRSNTFNHTYTLSPNTTGYIYITGTISDTMNNNTRTNIAVGTCSLSDPTSENCGNGYGEVTAMLSQIELVKSLVEYVPGDHMRFSLCARNLGASSLANYDIADYLPNTMSYVDNSAKYQYRSGQIIQLSGSINNPISQLSGSDTILTRSCQNVGGASNALPNTICPLQSDKNVRTCVIFDTKSKR